MFTNLNGCTVWEKTTVNRAPAYIRHEEGALYWEDTRGQEISTGTGITRTPENGALILIPAVSVNYVPKPGERIVSGICPDAVPPPSAMTVMKVRDFRYSSPKTAHIEVTAE